MSRIISPSALFVVLMLACLLVLALAFIVGPMTRPLAMTLSDLLDAPLTNHAAQAHAAQYNADTINAAIKAGTCAPVIIYDCPTVQQIKVICQIKAPTDLWGGLIIGTAGGHSVIVTGYAARLSYWQAAAVRDGCAEAVTP